MPAYIKYIFYVFLPCPICSRLYDNCHFIHCGSILKLAYSITSTENIFGLDIVSLGRHSLTENCFRLKHGFNQMYACNFCILVRVRLNITLFTQLIRSCSKQLSTLHAKAPEINDSWKGFPNLTLATINCGEKVPLILK